MNRRFALAVRIALIALAASCAWARPVALRPVIPTPPAYATADARSAPDQPAAVPAAAAPAELRDGPWWTAFADPALDSAIREAIDNNYAMRDIRTLIYENQLDPSAPRGLLWPLQISIPAAAQHLDTPNPPTATSSAFAVTTNQIDVGVTATYELDVWGQLDVRRRTADDLVEQQRQNTERFAQSLAVQVAQLWFDILELRAQRELLERQVQYSQALLALVQARFEQQLVTRLVVLQQEQQLLNTRAQVPLVVAQLALLDSRLTALLGRTPIPRAELVPSDRRLPDLPAAPSIGAPGDLIQSHPDLRLAQARVAEAEHLVSQNLASWLPTIKLFGSTGVTSYELEGEPIATTSFGVQLSWAMFDGGQRIVRARQLELTVQRRNWQYQSAFNDAVQRVQDALTQERKQTEHVSTLQSEVDLGRRVLAEARQLFEQGQSDYLQVVTALADLSSLERASLQARKLLLTYRMQLYFALGGTWSKTPAELDP